VFVEFEEGDGVLELAARAIGALGLDLAQLVEAFLELPGEAIALDAEVGEEAMGIDDVECDLLIEWDGSGGARQDFGFEERDAVETPGSVGELLNELRFGGSGGLVFVEEAAARVRVSGGVFGREDGGSGREAVAQGVERRTLLAGGRAGTGRELRIRTVRASARWLLAIGVGIGFVMIGFVMEDLAIGIACRRGDGRRGLRRLLEAGGMEGWEAGDWKCSEKLLTDPSPHYSRRPLTYFGGPSGQQGWHLTPQVVLSDYPHWKTAKRRRR
jgi:hypothetical protein